MKKILLLTFAAILFSAGCSQKLKTEDNTPYICFSADAEQSFTMDFDPYEIGDFTPAEGDYFEYSVGNGEWQRFNSEVSGIAFGGAKGTLRLRGKSIKGSADAETTTNIKFGTSAPVRCSGDIRTLVDFGNYKNADTKEAMFYGLFSGCDVLISAPELPATELAPYCYNSMFEGCSSLETAPALPATNLTDYCYASMFYLCTALKDVPELPARQMAESCYSSMFNACTALKNAPELPATSLAENCYHSMFASCASLETAPALPASKLAPHCYQSMFYNCAALKNAPQLTATELVKYCYMAMFRACPSLTEIQFFGISGFETNACLREFLNESDGPGTIYIKDEATAAKFKAAYKIGENWKFKYRQ